MAFAFEEILVRPGVWCCSGQRRGPYNISPKTFVVCFFCTVHNALRVTSAFTKPGRDQVRSASNRAAIGTLQNELTLAI